MDTSTVVQPRADVSAQPRIAVASSDTGLLILRVVFGLLFAGHGTQKLFGWFGGRGIEGTGEFLASNGYTPGELYAVITGLS